MATNGQDTRPDKPAGSKSTISCYVCRRRKVKCGKELPHCVSCRLTSQQCEYPQKAHRPGPKLGSTRGPNKRHAQGSCDGDGGQPEASRRRLSNAVNEPSENAHQSEPMTDDEQSAASEKTPWDRRTMQTLAFLVHPTHEPRSPSGSSSQSSTTAGRSSAQSYLADSCCALGVTLVHMDQLINQFFVEFHSFSLFRECDFDSTLRKCTTPLQHRALLATICIFATKNDMRGDGVDGPLLQRGSSTVFADLALQFVEEAIQECGDEPIPMVLLQAVILLTHWLLGRGVRGRAWRYLGVAVRAALELELHLVDAEPASSTPISPQQWIEDEERRRAWWAVWEMDVYASVIRRCRTEIDWSQNKTFLPVSDGFWAKGEPRPSCYLHQHFNERWKALKASQNDDPKTWYILINSLMKDAQTLNGPLSVEKDSGGDQADPVTTWAPIEERSQESHPNRNAAMRLAMIRNALYCTLMALPHNLRYRGGPLTFGAKHVDRFRVLTQRKTDTHIYGIHFASQLTKTMIAKGYFIEASRDPSMHRGTSTERQSTPKSTAVWLSSHEALDLALEASDEILMIIRRSCDDQFRYVNPFFASTIWFAGAVQMIHRHLRCSDATERALVDSNFALLRLSHQQFATYWNLSVSLREHLEDVESGLRRLTMMMHKQASTERSGRNSTPSFGRSRKATSPGYRQASEVNDTAMHNYDRQVQELSDLSALKSPQRGVAATAATGENLPSERHISPDEQQQTRGARLQEDSGGTFDLSGPIADDGEYASSKADGGTDSHHHHHHIHQPLAMSSLMDIVETPMHDDLTADFPPLSEQPHVPGESLDPQGLTPLPPLEGEGGMRFPLSDADHAFDVVAYLETMQPFSTIY